MFTKLLFAVLGQVNIGTNISYKDLSVPSILVLFVNFIANEMNCKQLSKRVVQWFNETKDVMKSTFSIRFRGKESNNYLKTFPKLIKVLLTTSYFDIGKYRNRLFQVFYQSLQLRALVSYSTRMDDVPEEYFSFMRKCGINLFMCCAFYDEHVSPSLWTFILPCCSSSC